ncbi:MAG TPA: hypothetical protein VIQ03_07650 [Gammaproteobacteria bacterium]
MKKILVASLIYFSIVFGAGFVLGVVRVLLLVPTMGERYAELLEMPLMLIVIFYSAQFIVSRYTFIKKSLEFLFIGIIAFSLLVLFELTLVLAIRDLTIEQYMKSRDPVSGIAYALSLIVYMIMPFVFAKTRSNKINQTLG